MELRINFLYLNFFGEKYADFFYRNTIITNREKGAYGNGSGNANMSSFGIYDGKNIKYDI
jgi:hypothetical protein